MLIPATCYETKEERRKKPPTCNWAVRAREWWAPAATRTTSLLFRLLMHSGCNLQTHTTHCCQKWLKGKIQAKPSVTFSDNYSVHSDKKLNVLSGYYYINKYRSYSRTTVIYSQAEVIFWMKSYHSFINEPQ